MNSATERSHRNHERKDVDVMSVMTIVLMLVISCGVISLSVGLMIHYFKWHASAKTAGKANIPVTAVQQFPGTRLEVKPGASLAELRAAEDADLNSYGWIDRNSGTIRIPIERAMQLLLERGLPDVGQGETPLSLMQARPNETANPPRLMRSP